MPVLHVMTWADQRSINVTPDVYTGQMRCHASIPWTEGMEQMAYDHPAIVALLTLARAAAAEGPINGPSPKGRLFEAIAVCIDMMHGMYADRDLGPYAVITDEGVLTTYELALHLRVRRLKSDEWERAGELARALGMAYEECGKVP